jgi:hypothetical protein
MLDFEKVKIIVDSIKKTAVEKHPYFDNIDFSALDHSGGNYDDAFALGYDAGWIAYARKLQSILEK